MIANLLLVQPSLFCFILRSFFFVFSWGWRLWKGYGKGKNCCSMVNKISVICTLSKKISVICGIDLCEFDLAHSSSVVGLINFS